MVRIQLLNDWLDTYIDEEIQLSWDGFRFQKSLRAGYTNDLNIPKTSKNLSLLGAVGLLDSQTQMFGTKTASCIVQTNLQMIPMMIQVAGVTAEEIKVCLYEDTFPEYYKGKTIKDLFVDGPSTIRAWNKDTVSKYPTEFRNYNYGMPYNAEKAQYHAVRPLRNILNAVASQGGYIMPTIPQDYMLLASKKTVCPQNLRQVIEFNQTSMEGDRFKLHGGQHITNDLSMDENEFMTFNRNNVFCDIKVYILWEKRGIVTQNKNMYLDVNGQHSYWLPLLTGSANFGYQQFHVTQYGNYEFNEGDTLSFSMPDIDKLRWVSVIVDITYTTGGWFSYISEDDYGTELEYVGRHPEFRVGEDGYQFIQFDGSTQSLLPWGQSIQTVDLSFAYFGYYCNLPEMNVCDMWYSLQWILGGKLSFDHQRLVTLESADEYAEIEGLITEIRPKTDKLGQKNYIKFKGEDAKPVFTIPNEWLSMEYTIHESSFYKTYNPNYTVGCVQQYSEPEYDEDFQYWTCDFNEIEGVVILNLVGSALEPIQLHTFDMEMLNQTMEVDITTFTPLLRNKDIIYLDGRRFLVINGKSSLDNQKTNLTCLLFPIIKAKTKSTRI